LKQITGNGSGTWPTVEPEPRAVNPNFLASMP
jgi:hypothetical protein